MVARLLQLTRQGLSDLRFERTRKGNEFSQLAATSEVSDVEESLARTMAWLRRTYEQTGGQGCSRSYGYVDGWRDAYPETTGYIARTFFAYADHTGDSSYEEQGAAMLDWLETVQQSDGGILGGTVDKTRSPVSIIFNTGMVLGGWVAGHERLGQQNGKYYDALEHASDFLTEVRGDEKRWLQHSYGGITHTYHSRVAWYLLAASKITGSAEHRAAALDILDWVVEQQRPNGSFANCIFTTKKPNSNTHGLAYTIRGLLEADHIEPNEAYRNAAIRGADALLDYFEKHRRIPAYFDATWQPTCRPECLTGIAQLSIIWFKLAADAEARGESGERYRRGATDGTDLLRAIQGTHHDRDETRGAIKGSHPTWGPYLPLQFPNWAAKFFADALLLRIRAESSGS